MSARAQQKRMTLLTRNLNEWIKKNIELIGQQRDFFPIDPINVNSSQAEFNEWKAAARPARAAQEAFEKKELLEDVLHWDDKRVLKKDQTKPKMTIERNERRAIHRIEEEARVNARNQAIDPELRQTEPINPRPKHNFEIKIEQFDYQECRKLVQKTIFRQVEAEDAPDVISITDFMYWSNRGVEKLIRKQLKKNPQGIEIYMKLKVEVYRHLGDHFLVNRPEGVEEIYLAGPTKQRILSADIDTVTDYAYGAVQSMLHALDAYQSKGSNLKLLRIVELEVTTHKFLGLNAGGTYIKAPDVYQNTKAIVNIQNTDNLCFFYNCLAQIFPQAPDSKGKIPNRYRPAYYEKLAKNYDLKGFTFPISCNDKRQIKKVEKLLNCAINIYDADVRKEKMTKRGAAKMIKGKDGALQSTTKGTGATSYEIRCDPHPLYCGISEQPDIPISHQVHMLFITQEDVEKEIEIRAKCKSNINDLLVPDLPPPLELINDEESVQEDGVLIETAPLQEDGIPTVTAPLQEAVAFATTVGHYALITSFDKMMFGYNSSDHKKFFCPRCFSHYTSAIKRDAHIQAGICLSHDAIKTILPSKEQNNHLVEHTNFKFGQECPYAIFCDFEANLAVDETAAYHEHMSHIDQSNATAEEKEQYSVQLKLKLHTKHVLISYALKLVSTDPNLKQHIVLKRRTTETDAVWNRAFLDDLFKLEFMVKDLMKKKLPLALTQEEQASFEASNVCHICDHPFLDPDNVEVGKKKMNRKTKCRDHDHITGKYRGPAHNACNLNYNCDNYMIPVIFHNGKGYDFHFIIKNLSEDGKKRRLTITAANAEKFMSFKLGSLKFIDSYAFLSSSLSTLVTNVGTDLDLFPILKEELTRIYPSYEKKQLEMLVRKGVYPYEYMNSLSRFEETSLPPIESFYSKLSQSNISQTEYDYAQLVWSTFKIKNMGEYHDLYLMLDVLLLADVFQRFRKLCLLNNKLDPCWYISLPSFSWDCALKVMAQPLELITEHDMYFFVEDAIRGGVSMITKRQAMANNPLMAERYKKDDPLSYILYLDANNLYGLAMSDRLPQGNFKWVLNPESYDTEKILSLEVSPKDKNPLTINTGYFIECDVDYPAHLHDKHNDLPFMVEHRKPGKLSSYADALVSKSKDDGLMKYKPSKKLIGTLGSKKKYVIHYRNLQQALKNGLILTKVHRILSFDQSAWLAAYIKSNTDKRALAKNDFEKDFYKLMNNAVFGKSMEQVRNHIDYRIVCTTEQARKLLSSPLAGDTSIINEGDNGTFGIAMKKKKVILNKPIFAGFAILELSKNHMYDFHYEHMMKLYPSIEDQELTETIHHPVKRELELLMTDTDSLVYQIHSTQVFENMKQHLNLYDTSDYPKDHPCYSKQNAKVIGKMKDEMKSKLISGFVGLRSKLYSVQMDQPHLDLDKEGNIVAHQKGKGIPGKCLKDVKHEHYTECLETGKETIHTSHQLRSVKHEILGKNLTKKGLCRFDDKRPICDDGIHTYPYGHWRLTYQTLGHALTAEDQCNKDKLMLQRMNQQLTQRTQQAKISKQ